MRSEALSRALILLAEAFHVPDAGTINELIEDTIAPAK